MPATEPISAPALDTRAEQARGMLEQRVDGVRTRSRFKFIATGLSLGLVVFIAAFLGFSLADILFKFTPSGRFISLSATLFGMAAVGYWFILRPWTRLGGSIEVARSVERAYPQLEEQLSTALEYGRDGGLALKTSSPALVGALLTQVAEKSDPLDFKRTIRWKEFAIALAAAFFFALAMGAFYAKDSRLFGLTFSRFLNPIGDLPVPTLTVIKSVEPGDDPARNEVPVETSVPVVVELEGRMPPTATLSVWLGEGDSGRWEDRVMDRGEDGKYRATLRRLLENTRYRIKAGDAESPEFKLQVYKLPEISEFTLRLEHPSYTGRGTETLAPGVGDVRALAGTTIHVDVTANTDLSNARVHFKSGREKAAGAIDSKDARRATLSFKLNADDEYQVEIANTRNKSTTGSLYLLKALKDRAPKVNIRRPEKDLMVHRAQTVNVEISAEDDIGVREIGISHSLGLEETEVLVRRLDPPATRADGKLVWELSNMALKGGEVIAYYAYALDNDTLNGPKKAKSDIHFITVYDEQEYENQQNPRDPNSPQMQTPPAVRQLDKLIDVQKKILRETFAQARQREGAGKEISEAELKAAQKTAASQQELKTRVDTLFQELKEEVEKETEAPAGPRPGGQQGPQLGEKELGHIEKAIGRMDGAISELKKPDTTAAVRPETEALRHLSETRRLLLSDQEGDPRFKSAANRQSKKQQQQERSQEEKDQQSAREELAELPKMMDREKKVERELEELRERRQRNPQPQNPQQQTEEQKREQDEQRRLQRQAQDELQRLAQEAEQRARKLEELAARNPDMRQAAEKMEDAARSLRQAAEEAKKQEQQAASNAQQKTQEAQKQTQDSQRSLRNATEKQLRNELANAAKDAQELAQKQNDIAQQMRELNQQQNQQGQQQSGQQPQQGQQQPGQQQGQQQSGQQPGQQGQQSGQQPGQQGQQGKQGQQPGQTGSQSAQSGQQQGQGQQGNAPGQSGKEGQSAQQQLAGLGRQQRDVQADLKELAERLQGLAGRAGEKGLGGAQQIEQAGKQAGQGGAASDAAQKTQEAMGSGKNDEAQREAAKASKAMDQIAQSLQDAVAKTGAADMKELAGAMRKLQGLSKEQGDLNKDAAQRRDASQLASKQEKIGEEARQVADNASKLEALRRAGRERSAATHLDEAAKLAAETAQALRNQEFNAAKDPGEKAERALNQALNDMELAAGVTLQEKARQAQDIARAAREKQAGAADDAKQIAAPNAKNELTPDAAKQRDQAAAQQQQAAREARRLNNALEGLEELAKEANPAAADIAREAREILQRNDVQKSMEDLARGLEALGQKKRDPAAPAIQPVEASKKGEDLAKNIKDVEKNLDAYIAEAIGNQLDRLRAMEQAAREAAEKTRELAKQNDTQKPDSQKNESTEGKQGSEQTAEAKGPGKQPGKEGTEPGQAGKEGKEGKEPGKQHNPKSEKPSEQNQADKLAELARDLQRLQPRLERLEPNAPERVKMREAAGELDKLREASRSTQADPKGSPAPGLRNTGGPAFQRIAQSLDDVVGGLHERVERIQRARDIRPEPDEVAPKEYRALVDRYFGALSEDTEEEGKK